MDKLKKIAKEWGIFLLVVVITAILAGYHALRPTTYKTISEDKVVSMLNGNDDFILVVGQNTKPEDESAKDYTSATAEELLYVGQYIKDEHDKVYYLSTDDIKEPEKFLKDNFNSESAELPQIFLVVDGEVYRSKTGLVEYYNFSKLVSDWKEQK